MIMLRFDTKYKTATIHIYKIIFIDIFTQTLIQILKYQSTKTLLCHPALLTWEVDGEHSIPRPDEGPHQR